MISVIYFFKNTFSLPDILSKYSFMICLAFAGSAISFGQNIEKKNLLEDTQFSIPSINMSDARTTLLNSIYTTAGHANTWTYISNPYSFSLSAEKFAEKNQTMISGTIYISNTPLKESGTLFSDGYSVFNSSGGAAAVGTLKSNLTAPEFNRDLANGSILPKQDLLVKSLIDSDIIIDASMDMKIATVIWAADESKERNRYWLNLIDSNGNFSQTLIGYFKNATDGIDPGFDGDVFMGSHVTFYSMCDQVPLSIQGRAMPITLDKYIELGYTSNDAGTLSISVADTELNFNTVLPLLLKDGVAGGMHNIKEAPYYFTTAAGTFNDRFEVHYTDGSSKISTEIDVLEDKKIIAYQDGENIVVKAKDCLFTEIEVYDMHGNILKAIRNVQNKEAILDGIKQSKQLLLLNVKTIEGKYITKRLIF